MVASSDRLSFVGSRLQVALELDHGRLPGPLLAAHHRRWCNVAARNDGRDAVGLTLERLEKVVHLLVPLHHLRCLRDPAFLRLLDDLESGVRRGDRSDVEVKPLSRARATTSRATVAKRCLFAGTSRLKSVKEPLARCRASARLLSEETADEVATAAGWRATGVDRSTKDATSTEALLAWAASERTLSSWV